MQQHPGLHARAHVTAHVSREPAAADPDGCAATAAGAGPRSTAGLLAVRWHIWERLLAMSFWANAH